MGRPLSCLSLQRSEHAGVYLSYRCRKYAEEGSDEEDLSSFIPGALESARFPTKTQRCSDARARPPLIRG